ncbi:galectin-9-like isoform X2 [Rana temporaria]|uniref:galectin-9-like isoform X2 n=1 Tax=Rana temporaria TaxID=8407 RepID=UPI001AADCA4E|nr:galectin-9-like isoform X2 [Rana temporaria]
MAGYAPIYNPVVPFQSAILGGISDGKRVTLQGQVHSHAKSFAINFDCFKNDIAFHFNPRFDEGNVIVCNTMQNNNWGSEERKHHMPFQRNAYFDVAIVVVGHAFQVTVNGQFLLEYRHRVSFQGIQSLSVKGDVSLSCVTFHPSPAEMTPAPPPYTPCSAQTMYGAQMTQPMYGAPMVPSVAFPVMGAAKPQKGPTMVHNPVMPFQAAFPKSFANIGNIVLTGNVPYGADRFHVNLLNNKTRNIHLHMNPRFNEGTIVRNTQNRGAWGPEERQLAYMPFCQGQNFQMEIRNEGGVMGVYSNGSKLFNYVHRLPANQIDTIEVGGNVTLTYVQY